MKTEKNHQKLRVLFLCTGNSCRSQMAEAIINARLHDDWLAYSAGTNPEGYVHPKALDVLREICINHSGISKSVEQFENVEFTLVITVCDSAAEECPVWLGKGQKIHMGFPDPAKATGSDEEILKEFRHVRDSIIDRIIPILESWADEELASQVKSLHS